MEKGMGMGRMGLRLLVALGLVLCILTGWKAALGTLALLRSRDAPLPTTVARAPEHRWVVLTDAVLDCATQQVRQRTALVLADDASGEHLFVAQLASPDGCAVTRRLDGVFVERYSRDYLRERQKLDLPPGPALRVFSQSQAPRFLRRALGWQITWFGLSVLLTVLGVRAVWAGGPDAIRAPGPAEKIGLGARRD
jgi:hypothetical protein